MIIVVLGAPGSGKTTVVEPLAGLLPRHVVLNWDAFMAPAGALAGRDIPANPETWPAYRELVRTIISAVIWPGNTLGASFDIQLYLC